MGLKSFGPLLMMMRRKLSSGSKIKSEYLMESCTPEECIKCIVSLLRDNAYHWWKTLVSMVPREWVNWEFFQSEFQKKYISQRFLDQKHKEFLELKHSWMTVTEYEREFVRLSKYAREDVSTEEIMCKRFVDGLNEDIKLLVRILELKEFVRACKADDLSKEKRKANSEAKDSRKRSMMGHSNRDRERQHSSFKAPAISITSVKSAKPNRPECRQCEK
ncbi:Gag-Pol polyprotein [Gossypium australe]|uniref:Gag-Pol polyprotein n=1 Tax=Gossypium australe TaxID=47621 RepID=A0A5B6VP06_9ROSI|nr:Gag-Pol polyprotein [Gossypium australe]